MRRLEKPSWLLHLLKTLVNKLINMRQTNIHTKNSIKEFFMETVTEETTKEKVSNIILALLVTFALAFCYSEVGYGRGWPYTAALHDLVGSFSDYGTH